MCTVNDFKNMPYIMEGSNYVHQEYGYVVSGNIAVVYSIDNDSKMGTLHKHGDPRNVKTYYERTVKCYKDAGLLDLAAELKYVEGQIPLEHLNKSITNSGYIPKFHSMFIDT